MLFSQLKASLVAPKKIYLIEGEDDFFRSRAESLIKNAYLLEPDFNLTNFEGSALKSDISALIGAFSNCPFMSDYRIIVIKEWYPLVADFKNKQLSNIFNTPLDGSIIIINNKQKSDLLKKQTQVEFVDCKKADSELIARYLQAEAMKEKLIISRSSCELIAEYCQFDMSLISVECAKLISYCKFDGEITPDAINLLVTKETDYKIYEIVNFIASKKYDLAFETFNDMIESGSQQILLVSLYYHFRRLLLISISNQSDLEIANQLGIKEYAVKKSREQAKKFSPKRLMQIVNKLAEYDSKFKSGLISLDMATSNAVFMILTEG